MYSNIYDERYTNADMKIWQYTRLHLKNDITQISHYNAFHFLRYAHYRYRKCLLINIQKQKNTLKSSLLFKDKMQTLGASNSRISRIKDAKFSGFYFHMNTNIQGDFQICIRSNLLVRKAANQIKLLVIILLNILFCCRQDSWKPYWKSYV